jgi:uncharacterized membrane protein
MENKIWIIATLAVIVLGVAALTNGFGMLGTTSVIGATTGATTGAKTAGVVGAVRIPLSEISSKAKFYEYDADGATITFFAVQADDGSVKTGFDECDVCYNTRKGYRQEGNYMVCNNCGNRYPISGLGTENKKPGGCWPGYLPSTVEGDNLVIKKSDLESGRWMFA